MSKKMLKFTDIGQQNPPKREIDLRKDDFKEIYDEFNKALKDRGDRGHYAEITFIGIKSADIKEHKKIDKALQVTVDFVSEIITCIRDKEKKIVSGSPDKIKTIYDTWTFSRDMRSNNPNWLLVNTLN